MGRELHRVALDFEWPLKKVWKGFLNPYFEHCHKCPRCKNGYNAYGQLLNDLWYGFQEHGYFSPEDNGSTAFKPDNKYVRELAERHVLQSPEYYGRGERAIVTEAQRLCNHYNKAWSHHLNQDDVNALVESGRLWDFVRVKLRETTEEDIRTHAYFLWVEAGCPEGDGTEFWEESVADHENYWLPYNNGYIPTAQEVNEWSLCSSGHDSINNGICVRARAEREGKETTCSFCKGHGSYWESPEYEKLADEWTEEKPPAGEGYQIWETVSEGSPVSPVFETPEELARWMVNNDRSVTKDTNYEGWLRFINGPGWAPSMIGTSEGLKSGVAAIVEGVN